MNKFSSDGFARCRVKFPHDFCTLVFPVAVDQIWLILVKNFADFKGKQLGWHHFVVKLYGRATSSTKKGHRHTGLFSGHFCYRKTVARTESSVEFQNSILITKLF